jgi:hypothetical protein
MPSSGPAWALTTARATTGSRAVPAGSAIAAAMMAGTAAQHITMVITWRGVIPSALCIPRSWTRSLACISSVLKTPIPASTTTSQVSRRNSPRSI